MDGALLNALAVEKEEKDTSAFKQVKAMDRWKAALADTAAAGAGAGKRASPLLGRSKKEVDLNSSGPLLAAALEERVVRRPQSCTAAMELGVTNSPMRLTPQGSARSPRRAQTVHNHRRVHGYEQLASEAEAEAERMLRGDQPPWQQKGQELIEGISFQMVMSFFILVNSVVIGVETDNPGWWVWDPMENVFLLIFSAEATFRVLLYGRHFYRQTNPDFIWNVLDTFIIGLGIFDAIIDMVKAEMLQAEYVTIFRTVRVLRILRIIRIVRFLRQLYTLAIGFALSTIAVFWVTFLMGFVLYISAIILVRSVGRTAPDYKHHELMQERFGDVRLAMLTLFQLISVPDLSEFREVMTETPLLAMFFVCFVIFGSFGMIAMLTGVISQGMFEKNMLKMQEETEERQIRRRYLVCKCEEMFNTLPMTPGGEVSRDTLVVHLDDLRLLFEESGVVFGHDDLLSMIEIIDSDGSGTISKEEFRHFIFQMAEGIRPMLILELYYAIAIVKQKIEKHDGIVEKMMVIMGRSAEMQQQLLGEMRKEQLANARRIAQQHDNQAPSVTDLPVATPQAPLLIGTACKSDRGKCTVSKTLENVWDASMHLENDIYARISSFQGRLEKLLQSIDLQAAVGRLEKPLKSNNRHGHGHRAPHADIADIAAWVTPAESAEAVSAPGRAPSQPHITPTSITPPSNGVAEDGAEWQPGQFSIADAAKVLQAGQR